LGITHRRTAYNHPEGNSYIERFHRSLKEEDVWLNEYQNFDRAKLSIAHWIEEYNHDRPHRGLHGQTPHDARARFAHVLTSNTAPGVQFFGVHYRLPRCVAVAGLVRLTRRRLMKQPFKIGY
jgi:hypothetical protein